MGQSARPPGWTIPHDQQSQPHNGHAAASPAVVSVNASSSTTSQPCDAAYAQADLKCADREARTLCMTLAYGGCRLSEALALTADRVDLAGGLLLFESLKKRRRGIHRAVPVPPSLLDALDLVHGIRKRESADRIPYCGRASPEGNN